MPELTECVYAVEDGKKTVSFSFHAPTRPLSENESRGQHWGAKKRRLDPWKEVTDLGWYALKELPEIEDFIGKHGLVQLYLAFDRTEKQWAADRRDPHNYVGTMCKTVIDRLTDMTKGKTVLESRLWPDDTPEWVKVLEPILVRGTVCTVKIIQD